MNQATIEQEDARRTQHERRTESNRRMLDAATHLIATQGIAKTTLAQVGEAAGYSRGLASQRYGTKTRLLAEVLRDIQRKFASTKLLRGIEHLTGAEAILKSIDIYFDEFTRDAETTRAFHVLLTGSISGDEELAVLFVQANELFRSFFEDLLLDPEVRKTASKEFAPAVQARLIVGVLRGVTLEWLIDPEPGDLQELGKYVQRVILKALSPYVDITEPSSK